MTNLEFHKKEIIEKTKQFGIACALISVYQKYVTQKCDIFIIINWLCEEHQILDKEEKKYLSNVIRPFANRMVSITKIKDWIDEDSNFEVLEIALRLPCKIRDMEFVHLPYFEKDTMYKGMELNKEYTLEELGL